MEISNRLGLSNFQMGNLTLDPMISKFKESNPPPITTGRGVIGEVRYGFLRIYAPTPYSSVFLLHTPAPAPIKIGFGAVRCGLVWCDVGAVLQFGLDSFGSDCASPNVNFNLKNLP